MNQILLFIDLIEANSMSHEPNMIDIYSASWGFYLLVFLFNRLLNYLYITLGPVDDGKTVDGPRHATMKAIVKGINEVHKYFL